MSWSVAASHGRRYWANLKCGALQIEILPKLHVLRELLYAKENLYGATASACPVCAETEPCADEKEAEREMGTRRMLLGCTSHIADGAVRPQMLPASMQSMQVLSVASRLVVVGLSVVRCVNRQLHWRKKEQSSERSTGTRLRICARCGPTACHFVHANCGCCSWCKRATSSCLRACTPSMRLSTKVRFA